MQVVQNVRRKVVLEWNKKNGIKKKINGLVKFACKQTLNACTFKIKVKIKSFRRAHGIIKLRNILKSKF